MAEQETVSPNMIWVRNMTDDGNYDYKEISEQDIQSYLSENPNAQGLMRNERNRIMPFRLSAYNKVDTKALYGITKKNIDNYDKNEFESIRVKRDAFKAFNDVLNDQGIAPNTPFYNLLIGTFAKETGFGRTRNGVGGKNRAKGLMQITGGTFNDALARFPEKIKEIEKTYNGGKPFTHEDLLSKEFDKVCVALSLVIWDDKLRAAGKKRDTITDDELGYLYAQFYNTGDKDTLKDEAGNPIIDPKTGLPKTIGDTVEGHTVKFNENIMRWLDTYTMARRYIKDVELHFGQPQQPVNVPYKAEQDTTQEQITNDVTQQEKANVDTSNAIKEDTITSSDVPTDDYSNLRTDMTLSEERKKQDALQVMMDGVIERAAQEVNTEMQQGQDNTVATSDAMMFKATNEGLSSLSKIEERASKEYEKEWQTYVTSPEINRQTREKYRKDYIDALDPDSAIDLYTLLQDDGFNNYVKSQYGIDILTASADEVNAAAQTSQEELDNLFNGMSDSEKEDLTSLFELMVLDWGVVQSDILDAESKKWGDAYNKALAKYFKPKSDAEYLAISMLTNSFVGKLITLGTDKRSRQIMDEQLANYGAGYGLQGIAGFAAGLIDLPLILAGAAAGGAIFNAASKLLSNGLIKGIAQIVTKGGRATKKAVKAAKKIQNATKRLEINTRWAKAQIADWSSRKAVQFGINATRAGVSSGFGMGLYNTASQLVSPYEFDQRQAWTSAAQGALLGVLDPFKQIVPGIVAKFGLQKKPMLWRRLTTKGGILASRVAFEATAESSAMQLVDLAINGDIKDFNFVSAVLQESPFTLALGFPEWFESVKPGAFGAFKTMSGTGRLAFKSNDWDTIQRVTGLKVNSISDVYKLSEPQKLHLSNMMNSKAMPVDVRNKFALISGDAGVKVSFSNVGNIHSMEVIKEKDGSFTYQSKDAQGRIITQMGLGYDEAMANAYLNLNKESVNLDRVNQNLATLASVDYNLKEPHVASIKHGQNEIVQNSVSPTGGKYKTFEEAEIAILESMQKPYAMRTDYELENIDRYNRYLNSAAYSQIKFQNDVYRAAMALDITPQEMSKVIKMMNRSTIELQMYDVYRAVANGKDIPDNDAVRRANERRDAKVRQKKENKHPVELNTSEEVAYMEDMTTSEKIEHINKPFISADGTIEIVSFADGTSLVRVTEQTGNVVYKDGNGNIVNITDAQKQEYAAGKSSFKVSKDEAIQYIQDIQAKRSEIRDEMLRSDEEEMSGVVMYNDVNGNPQVGFISKVNSLGDVELEDGTVIPQSQVTDILSDSMIDSVNNIINNGFEQIDDAESKDYWKRQRSTNYRNYLAKIKESYPDVNLSADVNNKIAALQSDVAKLEAELKTVKAQEEESGEDFSFTKREIQQKIDKKTAELTDIENIRDDYYKSYPNDKIRYDIAKKALDDEVAMQAKLDAEKKAKKEAAKAEAQRQKELDKQIKENEAKAKKETASKAKEEKKKAKLSEAELIKQQTKLMDFLLNPLNRDFNVRQFFEELTAFAKGTEMEESKIFNKVAFLKIGKAVVKGLKELHKLRMNLESGLTSLDPDILATAYKTKNTAEKNIVEVEKRLNILVEELEIVMLDNPEFVPYFMELRNALGEYREAAMDVEKLLQPQPEPKQIVTIEEKPKVIETPKTEEQPTKEVKTKSRKKPSKKEDAKVEDVKPVEVVEPQPIQQVIPVQMELDFSVQSEAVEPIATTTDGSTAPAAETATPESATEQLPTKESASKTKKAEPKKEVKSEPKEEPKPKAEPKKKAPVKIKPKAEPKKKAPKTETPPDVEFAEVATPQEIDFTDNKKLNEAKEKHSLSFNLKLNKKVDSMGEQGKDGYTETFSAEIEMSGYADNNSLGAAYDVLNKSNLYTIKGLDNFKTGDAVEVVNPKVTVTITYDKDGNIKDMATFYDKNGKITVKPMRTDFKGDKSANGIIKELNSFGITVKYGNEGEFTNSSQEAFYDSKRREIVINKDAEIGDAVRMILGHEIVHIELNKKDVDSIIEVFKDEGDLTIDDFNAEIENIKEKYKKYGRELTDAEAHEEFIAEYFGKRLFMEDGEILTADGETIRPLEIERFYERLVERKDELSAQLKDKALDRSAIDAEISQIDTMIKFMDNIMNKYKNLRGSKNEGFFESVIKPAFRHIQEWIKARKKAKNWNKDMLKIETLDDVFARAKDAVERNFTKGEVGEESQTKAIIISDEEVYNYIYKFQNVEPYFAEYIANNPDKFKNINAEVVKFDVSKVLNRLITRHLPKNKSRKQAVENPGSKAASDYADLLIRIMTEDTALYKMFRQESDTYKQDIKWAEKNFPKKFDDIDIEEQDVVVRDEFDDEVSLEDRDDTDAYGFKGDASEPQDVRDARMILANPLPPKPDFTQWKKDNGIKPGQKLGAKAKDWIAFQKDYQIAKELRDKAQQVLIDYQNKQLGYSEDYDDEYQIANKADGTLEMDTEAKRLAFEAVMKPLRENAGIKVVEATDAEVEQVLRDINVELSAKQKRALETVSVQKDEHHQTVISSADGTKVLKNLEILQEEYKKNTSTKEKTFIGDVAKSIGAKRNGSKSQYITFETKNGKVVTIRLSDHGARVSNFDNNGETDGISIVVSAKPNEGIINDGDAHIVEYYYNAIKLRRADGKPLASIVNSIKQMLYSGEFVDTTGLAERQEVNLNNIQPQITFRTSNGTIYGWSKGNEIHLTKAGLNPNTPIHEYTHLWAKAMINKNSKGWNSIKELLRNTPEWDRVLADDNYKDIRGNEDAVASEVLSRMSGTENAKRMIAEAQKMIDDNKNNPKAKANAESVLARIKQALNEFWSWVGKNLFDIEKFDSIEEVTDRVLYDLVNKTDLGELDNSRIEAMVAENGEQSMFRINESKKSGKEVGAYYRTLIKELGLKHKEKEDLMLTAVKTISKHLAGKNLRQLVSTKTDIRRVLKQLGEIANTKIDINTRERMLNDLTHELDDIVNENTAKILIGDVLDYARHINIIEKKGSMSALRRSGKYAGEEETLFLETAKYAINKMTHSEIETARDAKQYDIDSKYEYLMDNSDLDGETQESILKEIDKLQSQMDAYDWVLDALSVKKDMNARLKQIDADYAYAKKKINLERKKNPNSEESLRLQYIIDTYRDKRSAIVQESLQRSVEVTRKYEDTETLSRDKRKTIKLRDKKAMDARVDRYVDDMGGDESGNYMPVGDRRFQNKSNKGNIFARGYNRLFGSLLNSFSRMTVKQRGRKGALLEDYAGEQQQAQSKKFEINTVANNKIESAIKRIFGDKKNINDIMLEGNQVMIFNGSPVKLESYKDGSVSILATKDKAKKLFGKSEYTGNLTIQEAVQIVLTSEQVKGMQTLEKSGISQAQVDYIKSILLTKYKSHLDFGYALRDDVVKYVGEEAQKVHTELFGMGFNTEDNYYPLTATNGRAANSKGGIQKNSLFANSLVPGFLITRSSRVGEYRVSGAYDVALQYVGEMGQWVAYSPMSKQLNSLLMNEKFARNVKVKYGNDFYSQLKDYANITVGTFSPGISNSRILNAIYAVMKSSKLALRPITAIKQLYGVVGFHGYANSKEYWGMVNKNFAKAMAGTFKNNDIINWALENIPSIAERYKSGVGGEIHMGNLSGVSSSKLSQTLENWRIKGNFMNARADLIVVAAGTKSVYDYTYKQLRNTGVSHATAHKIAVEKATLEMNSTQGTTESAYLSISQRSANVNPIEKGLMSFQTPSVAIQRRVIDNIADLWYLRKKENRIAREEAYFNSYKELGLSDAEARRLAHSDMKGDAMKDFVNLWNIHTMNAVLFNSTNSVIQMLGALIDDDDERFDKYLDDFITTILIRSWAGNIPDLPIMSQGLELGKQILRGKKIGDAMSNVIGETYAGVITSSLDKWQKRFKPLWEGDGSDKALAALYLTECLLTSVVGVDADTINNYFMAAYDAVNGRWEKAIYEFLQMPPSTIKALDEVNSSESAQRNARKMGITPENRKRINEIRNRAREIQRDAIKRRR